MDGRTARRVLDVEEVRKSLGKLPVDSQARLARNRLRSTLDEYARMGLEDLKEHFAHVDPLHNDTVSGGHSEEARDLLERLRGFGPEGKEQAWWLLIDGLRGLISI